MLQPARFGLVFGYALPLTPPAVLPPLTCLPTARCHLAALRVAPPPLSACAPPRPTQLPPRAHVRVTEFCAHPLFTYRTRKLDPIRPRRRR
ncbi:hypothetical protein C8R44DRAFT_807025 [Mycena epipterygia]|nr:hypothetical protein C8R44DRAFT_807025 [Mycena epipterygia]